MPKRAAATRAQKRRVSATHQRPPHRPGSEEWKLGLIDVAHVEQLVTARKVGMPLVPAAELAGVPPELAQLWLAEGRRLIDHQHRTGKLPQTASSAYRARCIDLARRWDSAAAGAIAVLRGYMFGHAKKDPRACAQVLGALEREYAERQQRLQLPVEEPAAAPAADLAEPFAPLELAEPGRGRAAVRLTHTAADGSRTTAELGGDEFEGRSDAELAHYVTHGSWPEDTPLPPPAAIDTEGEEQGAPAADVVDEALAEELAAELAAAPPAAGVPLRRLEPGPLRELPEREVVEEVVPLPGDPPPNVPTEALPFPPLRRIDPLAGR